MLTALIATLSLLAAPELTLRSGAAITLDGEMTAGEWDDALVFERELPKGKRLEIGLKRTGPWLAIGLSADAAYRGETVRLYLADPEDAPVTELFSGLGNPSVPPLLWRRAPAPLMREVSLPAECPRAARLRLIVDRPDRWSAEMLVRMGALGIGRADLRSFRALFVVGIDVPESVAILTIPANPEDPYDIEAYAPFVSDDAWGADETWEPVSSDVSLEFDDNDLLYNLYLEHDAIEVQETEQPLLISASVRPRDSRKIQRLQRRLEEGRARNPGLPQWNYYLARLFHEANRYEEARALIDGFPEHLHRLAPVASLIADHRIDLQDFEGAREIIRNNPWASDGRRLMGVALTGTEELALENQRLERDRDDGVQNPRVRFETRHGAFVVELFEDDAPNAVRNFVDLVLRRQYYDGLRFHSVFGGQFAMIGDPRTRGEGEVDPEQPDGPGWSLKTDDSPRPLLRGYLATVPLPEGGFHGSQFVLALSPQLREQRRVVVFGRVISGQDVLESIDQGDVCEKVEVVFKRNHSYDALSSRIQ